MQMGFSISFPSSGMEEEVAFGAFSFNLTYG
jgi:hypothetical protein